MKDIWLWPESNGSMYIEIPEPKYVEAIKGGEREADQ